MSVLARCPSYPILAYTQQWQIQTFRYGGRPGHPDPEIRGGVGGGGGERQSPKKNFRPFGSQFHLKIRGGGTGPWAPSSGSATAQFTMNCLLYSGLNKFNKSHDTNFTRVISKVVNQAAFL